MRFQGSVEIRKPIDLVTRLFANPDNLRHYQDGFIRKELLSGNMGEDGAKSKLVYRMGKSERQMELIETVIANQLPDKFVAKYEHPMMDNTLNCRFVPIGDDSTRYEIEVEYTRFGGWMPRLMAFLFPKMFTKQGKEWMQNFKTFVESQ